MSGNPNNTNTFHQSALYNHQNGLYNGTNFQNNLSKNSTPSETISASSINLKKVTSISSDPRATQAEQISQIIQDRGSSISL